jgi:NhaA family Na+:H+ antiporter
MSAHRFLRTSPIERLLGPVSRFIRTGSSGGLVLMAAAAIALFMANSPWAGSWHHFWETEIALRVGGWTTSHTLHHWINDGLMAVFFFLVGLEIKREALVGELASVRRASLPAAAALGGMVVPAALYALINGSGPGAAGWGVPMATDIAFALGVLALLGRRVPASLKLFLTAIAIVDDIGAVLVIALFYTDRIDWVALAAGLVCVALAALANRLGVRRPPTYLLLGIIVWACFMASGVHATVAGVLMAMAIPARTRINAGEFLSGTRATLDRFEEQCADDRPVVVNQGQQTALHQVEELAEAAQAPLQRIEHELHAPVAFVIIPLFALANAGVAIPAEIGSAFTHPVTLGVIVGLLLGKPIGITLFSYLAVRLGWAELPAGLGWKQVRAVSWLGGIGFTMSLFIGELAFAEPAINDLGKIGIFTASLAAGVIGFLQVRRHSRAEPANAVTSSSEGVAPTDRERSSQAPSHAV